MKKYIKPIILLAILVFAIFFPTFVSSYITTVALLAFYYTFLSSAWNIIGGYAGQVGLGNGLYIGLGAYVTGVCVNQFQINPWISFVLAIVIVGVFSLLMGAITFPLSGTYYSLASMSLLNIMRMVFTNESTIFGLQTNGAIGIRILWKGVSFEWLSFNEPKYYYWVIMGLAVIGILICWYINHSKFGYYFKAIGDNQEAAASTGVPVTLYKQYAQFVSSAMLAVGGGFYCCYMTYIEPNNMFSAELAFNIVLMAAVGGRATIFGPLIGSFILYPFNEVLRVLFADVLSGLPSAMYGLVLMLVMQFMPMGLTNTIAMAREKRKLNKKLAEQAAAAAAAEGVKVDG